MKETNITSTERKFYVYEWFVEDTNEVFYVGKGSGTRYKTLSSRNKFFLDMYYTHHCNVRIVKSNLTEQEAFDEEIKRIKHYREKTNFRLTNVADGGQGSTGLKYTEEMRQKSSKANKLKWKDPKFRQRAIELRHDPNGPYQSNAFKSKISSLVSGDKNPNYGNKWTEEQKRLLSEKRKKNGKTKRTKNGRAVPVICLETGEVFSLINDAAKKYSVNASAITVALYDHVKTAGGCHWRKFNHYLLDENVRFHELSTVILKQRTNPIICVETKQVFKNKMLFLKTFNISKAKFNKEYSLHRKFLLNDKTFMYVKDYIKGRLCE